MQRAAHACLIARLPVVPVASACAAPPPSAEKPPLGCSSGAYKLLLGNVPAHVTEGDMAILLSQFGRVVHISLSPNVSSGVSSSSSSSSSAQAAAGQLSAAT